MLAGEVWFNARPMLLEVALPALLMGFSFPLANAITQRAERLVGRRAAFLYLANTLGAVCGSLAAGFVFLPSLGIQGEGSVTLLTTVAGLAVVPLYVVATNQRAPAPRMGTRRLTSSSEGGALAVWLLLPGDYVIKRALRPLPGYGAQLVSLREGLTEVISVTEIPGTGRTLPSPTGIRCLRPGGCSQRYMRALAHIPLLSMERSASRFW